jgi:pimeloyl-ACP methyl ester carboxylesterase
MHSKVPSLDLGGDGDLLFFAHANGYPPLAYRALLEPLTASHHVVAGLHRPLWPEAEPPTTLKSWDVFGEDVVAALGQLNKPAICMGHSMGSAALVMAAVNSQLPIKGLILIEPVLMTPVYYRMLRMFRWLARRRVPLIRRTLTRQFQWPSRQHAYDHFRPKSVFKRIGDEVLWDYVNHGLIDSETGQVQLAFSREWEAACYLRAQNIWHLLDGLAIPVLAIRGGESNTLDQSNWQRWQSKAPQHDYAEVPGTGHLVPFEKPEYLRDLIREWLGSRPELDLAHC